MKSILSSLTAFVLILGMSNSVFAWPSTGSRAGNAAVRAGKIGAKKGIEASTNKKLAKTPCYWNKGSNKLAPDSCNLDKIISHLNDLSTGVGASGLGRVRVKVNMTGGPNDNQCRERGNYIIDRLRGQFPYGSWRAHWSCSNYNAKSTARIRVSVN